MRGFIKLTSDETIFVNIDAIRSVSNDDDEGTTLRTEWGNLFVKESVQEVMELISLAEEK